MRNLVVSIALVAYALVADAAPEIRVATGGKALLPVVTAAGASARTRDAAESLADYLSRISGAKFELTTGDGSSGIAVGLASDFPALGLDKELSAEGPARLEQYLLRSHDKGLYAIGATELAVEHAAWDLLYHLGYRQFFPGEVWEHVPTGPDLRIAVDANEKPAYFVR
ncbi:MAG: hypothetical protein ACAI43_23450, partial [Phycisphaerae bacterium]